MKRSVSYKLLPYLTAALGAIVLILRFALYTMENQSGLLPHDHPLYIASLILAAFSAVVMAFFTARLKGNNEYDANFPFSRPRAQCSFLAGLMLFPVASGLWTAAVDRLELAWAVLGFVTSVCLIATGFFQFKNEKPSFRLHAPICLFYVFHLICKYRQWSGNPQMEDYVFSLFACIFLAIFAYHKTAFSVDNGKRRMLLFSGLMAVFFCIGAIVGDGDARFFVAGAMWAVSNLCVIDPPEA